MLKSFVLEVWLGLGWNGGCSSHGKHDALHFGSTAANEKRQHHTQYSTNTSHVPLVLRTKALRVDEDDPMKAVVAVGPATRKRSADWNFMAAVVLELDEVFEMCARE